MKKKLFVIALCIMMAAVMLAACSSGGGDAGSTDDGAATTETADGAADAENTQTPASTDGTSFTIGYVCNFMSHEWYQNVTNGAKRRAEELGITLEIADANQDSSQQISFAENFIAKGVDVLALTPVDATTLGPVIEKAKDAGIIVITESNPVGGEYTCVGADNKGAGKQAGEWFGNYGKDNNIDLKFLLVGFPNFEDCRLRVEGFKEGLEASGAKYSIEQEIDSQGGKEKALQGATDACTANPDINAIFGINDDSTQGGVQGYKAAGLDSSKLSAVGYGLEGVVGREALQDDTPIVAELAMFPDFVGACIVDASKKAVAGEDLPERYLTPTTMVTKETYGDFYTQEGDAWILDFDAVEALLK
ncbi:MAG: substrate-binding domain-containing protein [Clostridiales Family XIII bacterium]|jgi:ABC-type sugar transport system substrate-binding protein|nr:substrate-binding domain-containing protein [Clostridiales Family XIII bacterium]